MRSTACKPAPSRSLLLRPQLVTINCSYKRHSYITRNCAPTFYLANQPSVELFLESSETFSSPKPYWAIHVNGRLVYQMHPNPLDPDYNSYPNIHGCWFAADVKPGASRA